ncbi:MAG: hypothetical protein RL497_1672 [Pseudomonadota bacterium]|jgi:hypothetical protein
MGRYIVKITVFLAVLAGIGNYLVYLSTGRVPFNEIWRHYSKNPVSLPKPSLPSLDLPSLPQLPGLKEDGRHKAFKWTDKNGVIHYSDQAPDGKDATLIDMNPDRNLVQGDPQATATPEAAVANKKQTAPSKEPPAPNTQTPNYQDAIEQAKAAVEKMKAAAPQ